jgi:hypothetical protein
MMGEVSVEVRTVLPHPLQICRFARRRTSWHSSDVLIRKRMFNGHYLIVVPMSLEAVPHELCGILK